MSGGRGRGRRGDGEGHLRPALIRAFTRSLGIADAGALLHLLGCPACAGKAVAELGFRPASRIASDAPRQEPYDALFERLRTRLATYQAAEPADRERARRIIAELLAEGSPVKALADRVPKDPGLVRWPFAWELRAAAAAALPDDVDRAERLATLALVVAAVLEPEDAERAAAFRSGVWREMAAMRRLRGDLARAGEAMREAERYLRQASDADERAAFCRELAELRRAETRYEEALALFERAAGLFGDYGQLEDQAAAWIAEGDLHLRLADPARALPPFESAARLAEEGLDAGLALSAAIGAATALLAQGRTDEARRALGAGLARNDPRSITLQQRAEIDWIEGRIAAAAG